MNETITNALPLIISSLTLCLGTLATGVGAVWLYWKNVYQPNQEKRIDVSSTFNREQAHSSQVAYQVGESKRDAAFFETYGNMANHLITSNNGHMTGLTTAVIDGNKDVILALLEGFKDISIRQAQHSAAINQLNYFLQERTGQPLKGGDVGILEAAKLKTDAVKRSDDIVIAVEQHIKDAAIANDTQTTAHESPPAIEPGQQVIAIVKAEPTEVKE